MRDFELRGDTFIIRDYARKAPFSSFLPGLTGVTGIPMWSFYTNRGQGMCGFGIHHKGNAMMEFNPANTGYENTQIRGFRTFMRIDGKFHEPFFIADDDALREMEIEKNVLTVREEKDGWCLGEWCTPQKVTIPEPFVNTTMFISQLRMLAFCAKELGEDAQKYLSLIESHAQAVKDAYMQDGSFCGGVQGADAFALDCGLGDERTLRALMDKYLSLGEFDTGIFGTPILLRTLFENGFETLAYKLLTNTKDGSFDAMRRGGATTLWENWNGKASHNHPMFGAGTVCLFRYLLGIRQADNASGMHSFVIEPVYPDGLSFAEGSVTTPRGKIAVRWKKQSDGIRIQIRLCPGVQAVFRSGGSEHSLDTGDNEFTV